MSSGDRRDEDIRDEIAFHLSEEQDELQADGVASGEAGRAALRQFGSVARVQEDIRDVWVARWARELRQDLKFARSSLARTPGFLAAAVACLALGIGAITTVLSVANAVIVRGLPYPDADRLMVVYEQRPLEDVSNNVVSYADFFDWRARSRAFAAMAAWEGGTATFSYTSTGAPERVPGALVTAAFFDVLGVPVRAGRGFTPQDEEAGAPRVVIVTDGFWRRALAGAADVLGASIALDGQPHTIVGILPASFEAPLHRWQIFVPLRFDAAARANRGNHSLTVIARMRPDATLAQARSEMAAISDALEQEYPVNRGHAAHVVPMSDALRGSLQPASIALLGAAGLLLLIACFNVANLLLARAVSRGREMSVRAALGAGRSRILRQLLAEGLLLSCVGAGLGVVTAVGAVAAIRRLMPALDVLEPGTIRIDSLVLGAIIAVTGITTTLFGFVPALGSAGRPPAAMLRFGVTQTRVPATTRRQSMLVVAEATLAVMLLVGAGLLLRSFWALQSVDPGFRADRALALQLILPPSYSAPSANRAFQDDLLGRVRALPGVTSAGLTSFLPMTGEDSRQGLVIEDMEPDPALGPRRANWRLISPGYVETMQIPLVQGRMFDTRDGDGASLVMIVNETAARRYWPHRNPVGSRARLSGLPDFATVIGVVGDVRHQGQEAQPVPEAYLSFAQYPFWRMSLVVRTDSDPETLMPPIRRQLSEIDKDLPPVALRSMQDVVEQTQAPRRFLTALVLGFAALALALAAGGIYAQLAYWVSQRTHDLGVRLALGAPPARVIGMVLRQGLSLALLGMMLGLVGAIGLSRAMRGMLFGVEPLDAVTLATAPLVLLAAVVVSCAIPALRAARVDPVLVLRHE